MILDTICIQRRFYEDNYMVLWEKKNTILEYR